MLPRYVRIVTAMTILMGIPLATNANVGPSAVIHEISAEQVGQDMEVSIGVVDNYTTELKRESLTNGERITVLYDSLW